MDGRIVVNEPDSASRGGDTRVAESGFDGRETARTDDSELEYFDQTISSSTGDRTSSGPDTSTGLTQYGSPEGSLPNLDPSRRASSSLPPTSPNSSSQQTSHPSSSSSSSSSFSYISYAHSTLATLPLLSWVVPKPPDTPTQPLALRLMCTQGPLLAPPPPPYEALPPLLAHASGGGGGGGGTDKKTEKRLRKEAQVVAHDESAIELRTPTTASPGVARTAIVAGLGEGTGWLDGGEGGMGKLMYE